MGNRQLFIRICDNSEDSDSIPLMLLSNVLKGIQQTFYYIGLSEARYEVKSKIGRIPIEIRRSCELRKKLVQNGSFEMIAEVVEPDGQLRIHGDIGIQARDSFLRIIRLLSEGTGVESLKDIIADGILRRTILRSVQSYCPKMGDHWSVGFGPSLEQVTASLNPDVSDNIQNILIEPEMEHRYIAGELIRVHLDENKLSLYYKPTSKVLDCFYDPELENFIIGNLRGLIQVRGKIQLNDRDEPDRIVESYAVTEIDLEPLNLFQASSGGTTIKFSKPLEFEFTFDETEQEACLWNENLNIYAVGLTREEAIIEIEEDIIWLWKEYVNAPNSQLTEDACEFKLKLEQIFKEVSTANGCSG